MAVPKDRVQDPLNSTEASINLTAEDGCIPFLHSFPGCAAPSWGRWFHLYKCIQDGHAYQLIHSHHLTSSLIRTLYTSVSMCSIKPHVRTAFRISIARNKYIILFYASAQYLYHVACTCGVLQSANNSVHTPWFPLPCPHPHLITDGMWRWLLSAVRHLHRFGLIVRVLQ